MTGTVGYLVFAGIVIVIVVVSMLVWTVRQLGRTDAGTAQTKARKAKVKAQHPSRQSVQQASHVSSARADLDDDPSDVSAPTPATAQASHQADAQDTVAEQTAPEVCGHEVQREVAPQVNDPLAGGSAPMPGASEPPLDKAYAAPAARDMSEQDPAILGWLTVYADGRQGISDQEYDETVTDLFATLAEQAKHTADVVGLANTREFVVRGAEGTILIFPAARLVMGREDFVVLFVEEEVLSVESLLGSLDRLAESLNDSDHRINLPM